MSYYIATIIILSILSIIECTVRLSSRQKRSLLILTYIYIVIQVGLRWETGTDWDQYYMHFMATAHISDVRPTATSPEYGYALFVWLIHSITESYSVFLTIHAAIYFALIIFGIRHYTRMTYLPLLMVYSSFFGYTGANRQLLALAIGFYATRYLIDKKIGMYILLILLASTFHFSALVMLCFIFLRRKVSLRMALALLTTCIIIGYSSLPQAAFEHLGSMFGGSIDMKAMYYISRHGDEAGADLTIAGLLKRIMFFVILFYGRRKLVDRIIYYDYFLNIYLAGLGLYFLFSHSLLIIVSRGSLYFEIFGTILFSVQLLLFAKNRQRVTALAGYTILAVILFVESISTFSDAFIPYKGLFLNTNVPRTMY